MKRGVTSLEVSGEGSRRGRDAGEKGRGKRYDHAIIWLKDIEGMPLGTLGKQLHY